MRIKMSQPDKNVYRRTTKYALGNSILFCFQRRKLFTIPTIPSPYLTSSFAASSTAFAMASLASLPLPLSM